MRYTICILIFFLGCLLAKAQTPTENNNALSANDSTLLSGQDTTITMASSKNDTVSIDSVLMDTAPATQEGDIKTTIKYSAKDSIHFDVANQVVFLYGKSKIIYGETKLDAEEIVIDWEKNLISAQGKKDSTGKDTGTPVFTDRGQTYATKKMKYNFESRKAIISGLVTKQDEAFMHGEYVKKNEKDELFIDNAKYTTCDLAEPHFHIGADKLKLIPDSKIVSGPFNLVINNVPTPLGFSFGMFPAPNQRASGIIIPQYGEEQSRGFYLRNGGYYLALSDYVNLELLGEIYSKGSYGLYLNSNYKKRYRFDGGFNVHYNNRKEGNIEDAGNTSSLAIKWRHRPVPRGNSRFSSNVNFVTNNYNQNNALEVQDNLNTTFRSTVTYSKAFQGTPFSLNANMTYNQNVRTKELDFSLPALSLSMNRVFPLKRKGSSGNTWYQKLGFSYNLDLENRINNRLDSDSIIPVNAETVPTLLERARNGVKHSIPVSTTINFLKHFSLNPSFNYSELWYFKSLDHYYDDSLNTVRADTINGFSRGFSFNTGASINTTLYGTFNFGSNKKIQAIRHMIIPSVGFSYSPDFSQESYGFYKEVQTDSTGENTRLYSKYEGFIYGSPSRGKNGSISLNIRNNLEMKVRSKKDTITGTKKLTIFENLSLGTSYNLMADSFNLSNVSLNAATTLFNKKLDISVNGSLDPYLYILDSITTDAQGNETVYQRRVNEFAFNNGQGLGKITSANVRVGIRLNPRSIEKQQEESPPDTPYNPSHYVDFSLPWNLRIDYNLRYSRIGFAEGNITQTMDFGGDVNLTNKWKLSFSSAYDFEEKELVPTATRINIHRDLHCWELTFSWTPMGPFQSYNFKINIKASVLKDLQYSRNRNYQDR